VLILSRRKFEDIVITAGTQQIVVRLVELRPGKARIGIEIVLSQVRVQQLRGLLDVLAAEEV